MCVCYPEREVNVVVIWRISRHRNLAGMSGLRAGGRWHYPGPPHRLSDRKSSRGIARSLRPHVGQ